ncbi:MAG: hemerythrin domain-containing protein [Armatimonadota bacterium]|nr:hemerythrin domain-containing protein [Armatimonadota bacterium]MDR5674802.1 hemerythrin domain-containing protein [Armatimonadota bacterium]MDR5688200.1 hemerythrin domain-containing protein [Armatimonadota bacterium]MDR7387443.1 hemerythrin domain-containing protein [Armatimonadota bacterium]MDR7388171.1 hemerythrin domain-containing protein [Armatimonadota bacterium]
MSIVTYLLGEHGVLYALLDRVEELAPHAGLEEVRAYRDLLSEAIRSHAQVEDDLLFDPLERTTPRAESAVRGMRTMHDDIDGALDEIGRTGDLQRAREQLLNVAGLAKQHFFAEEEAVFPMAEEELPASALEGLGRDYLQRRGLLGMGSHV